MTSANRNLTEKFFGNARAVQIFLEFYGEILRKTDRLFAGLLIFEWLACVLFAVTLSPLTWAGTTASIHLHVYAAVFTGAVLALFPAYLIYSQPGAGANRYVISISQMLFSTLLIHLSGGRIESHFHIFGSLAFLAFYRDQKVLVTATLVTLLDHLLRGAYWPISIYGVLSASPLRAIEHVGWVLFEVVCLLYFVRNTRIELYLIALNQSGLEETLVGIESKVQERTAELLVSKQKILEQQNVMIANAKQFALGEMAGHAAHELNSPLAALLISTKSLQKSMSHVSASPMAGTSGSSEIAKHLNLVVLISEKMSKVVKSLGQLASPRMSERPTEIDIAAFIDDTLSLYESRFARAELDFRLVNKILDGSTLCCCPDEISQVVMNLLNNAFDAAVLEPRNENRWVELEVAVHSEVVQFKVRDGGKGIPQEHWSKLFTANFSTKASSLGSGLGLVVCRQIAERHGGTVFYDSADTKTSFVLEIPLRPISESKLPGAVA